MEMVRGDDVDGLTSPSGISARTKSGRPPLTDGPGRADRMPEAVEAVDRDDAAAISGYVGVAVRTTTVLTPLETAGRRQVRRGRGYLR